jgi:uncharacterized membrane protein YbhN (UPF0104 family)
MSPRENPDTGYGRSSGGNAGRRRILFWVKVGVSGLALFLIFRGTDLARISGFLAASRKLFWAAAFILMILSQVISTFRWRILLRPLDFDLPWPRVFRIYFAGMFFSLFLPTLVGGDGVKTYFIAGEWKKVPAALYSLLADRTIGLAALGVYALLGIPAVRGAWPAMLVRGVSVSVFLLYLLLLILPRLSTPALRVSRRLREIPPERLFVYWKKWRETGRAWLLSLGVHLCLVLAHISLARALGLTIPWAVWAVIYPVTAFVAFLPVSLSGIGPREAAYVYLMGLSGVSREVSLAFGIMWFSIVLTSGLIGGLIYVFGGELMVRDAIGK